MGCEDLRKPVAGGKNFPHDGETFAKRTWTDTEVVPPEAKTSRLDSFLEGRAPSRPFGPESSLAKDVQIAKKGFPRLFLSVNLRELCERKNPSHGGHRGAQRGKSPYGEFFHGMENGRGDQFVSIWIMGGARPLGAPSLPILSHVDIRYGSLKIRSQ